MNVRGLHLRIHERRPWAAPSNLGMHVRRPLLRGCFWTPTVLGVLSMPQIMVCTSPPHNSGATCTRRIMVHTCPPLMPQPPATRPVHGTLWSQLERTFRAAPARLRVCRCIQQQRCWHYLAFEARWSCPAGHRRAQASLGAYASVLASGHQGLHLRMRRATSTMTRMNHLAVACPPSWLLCMGQRRKSVYTARASVSQRPAPTTAQNSALLRWGEPTLISRPVIPHS